MFPNLGGVLILMNSKVEGSLQPAWRNAAFMSPTGHIKPEQAMSLSHRLELIPRVCGHLLSRTLPSPSELC